jgi:hypothetical protein
MPPLTVLRFWQIERIYPFKSWKICQDLGNMKEGQSKPSIFIGSEQAEITIDEINSGMMSDSTF